MTFSNKMKSSKAVNAVNRVMDRPVIQAKTVGPVKNPNCKFTFVQLVKLCSLCSRSFPSKLRQNTLTVRLANVFAKL